VIVNAFSQGGVAFVSQNVGAKKYHRINKIVITLQTCVFSVAVVLGNIIYFFAPQLLRLYTDSQAVVEAGMKRMVFACCFYFFYGMMDCMVAMLRGLGRSVVPMLVALMGVCGFRLLWIAVMFTNPAFHSIETVYIAYPLSWGITFCVHTMCFLVIRRRLKKKWGV
jgi:Na+-driven multidrug efflux pump